MLLRIAVTPDDSARRTAHHKMCPLVKERQCLNEIAACLSYPSIAHYDSILLTFCLDSQEMCCV